MSKISRVNSSNIPLVPRENTVFSASVRNAGNDWRKVSNSYAHANNITSSEIDKVDNDAHKRVQSWNVLDRWARNWGNYNEYKSISNAL